MRRLTTFLVLAVLALSAQGCTMAAVKAMDEVDKAISKLAQADCELVRVVHGTEVCRSHHVEAAPEPVYCYRRLGGVDCYAQRDPRDEPIVHEARAEPEPIRTTELTSE